MRIRICTLALFVASTQATAQAVIGSGYTIPLPVTAAPGQLVTLYIQGVGAGITSPIEAQSLPISASLAGISVSMQQSVGTPGTLPVPVLGIFPADACPDSPCLPLIAINLQIPYEMIPNAVLTETGISLNSVRLTVSESGKPVATTGVIASSDQIHVLRYGDSLMGSRPLPTGARSSQPVVTHPDGTLVTLSNPAQPDETVVIYAVGIGIGLGRTQDIQLPRPPDGNPPQTDLPAPGVAVAFDFRANASPSESLAGSSGIDSETPVASWAVAGDAGLYQINVRVPRPPASLSACGQGGVETNLTIDVNGLASYDGAAICVAIQAQ